MKRITIEGDWEQVGTVWVLHDHDGHLAAEANPDRIKVTVEDIPDPLPTEPGARFWGYCAKRGPQAAVPQYWFVQSIGVERIYRPADATVVPLGFLDQREAERMLVRQTDPDGAE